MTTSVKKNTIYRILAAVIALPVYIFMLYADFFDSITVLITSLVISLLCLYEYYKLCDKGQEGRPFKITGFCAAVLLNIAFYLYTYNNSLINKTGSAGLKSVFALFAVFIAAVFILQLFTRPLKGGIYSLAVTVFGVFYIVFFFSHIILMKALPYGFWYILILNIAVMINDSAAYFAGISIGKHKTKFPVSPNKSWEGYAAGLIFCTAAVAASNAIISSIIDKTLFSFAESIILGILLSIFGNFGDLAESAVKRDAAIKDSGGLVPGHGGMWDVFDALIFTCPLYYYYLIFRSGF